MAGERAGGAGRLRQSAPLLDRQHDDWHKLTKRNKTHAELMGWIGWRRGCGPFLPPPCVPAATILFSVSLQRTSSSSTIVCLASASRGRIDSVHHNPHKRPSRRPAILSRWSRLRVSPPPLPGGIVPGIFRSRRQRSDRTTIYTYHRNRECLKDDTKKSKQQQSFSATSRGCRSPHVGEGQFLLQVRYC